MTNKAKWDKSEALHESCYNGLWVNGFMNKIN